MAAKLKNLKASRDIVKATVSRIRGVFENLKDTPDSFITLNDRLEQLVPQLKAFNEFQYEIELLDEAELQSDSRTVFETAYFALLKDFKTYLKLGPVAKSTPTHPLPTSHSINATIKLPELNLPRFDGELSKWTSFIESFLSMVHENTNLSNIQKLHYLKSCLVNEPRNLVDSIPISDGNYQIAYDALVKRYNNKRLIIKEHIQAIFNIKPAIPESAASLHRLIDTVTLQLKILNSLNVPTEHWDLLIIHIITNCFDLTTRKEWEHFNKKDIPPLADLVEFVNSRCHFLESIPPSKVHTPVNKPIWPRNVPRRTTNLQTQIVACPICQGAHRIYSCERFLQLPVDSRISEVNRLRLCKNCLGSRHTTSQCNSYSCRICKGRHHSMLHCSPLPNAVETATPSTPLNSNATLCNVSFSHGQVLLSTAQILVQDKYQKIHKLRALLDVGAQSNFITFNAASKLQLHTNLVNLSISGVGGKVSSITQTVQIKFRSAHNAYNKEITCAVLPSITDNVPQYTHKLDNFKVPSGIKLADPTFNISQPIDILLGAELFWELLCVGQIKTNGQPMLQKTHLGWVVGGKLPSHQSRIPSSKAAVPVNLLSIDQQVAKFWNLEDLSNKKLSSKRDKYCEEHFTKNYEIGRDGRFIVRLPFQANNISLGLSQDIAVKRLHALERRLAKNSPLRANYISFLNTYEQLGHMSIANNSNTSLTESGYFLPHHAVLKEQSMNTKLRVVFDGSCKTTSGVSLNDTLMVGPTIQPELFDILLRFRLHPYVIIADIVKMYRQIWVHSSDRRFQKILWRKSPTEPIKVFELNTITYGTAPASFLATRCLNEAATRERDSYPIAESVILRDFYVDNLLTGFGSKAELRTARDQVTTVLNKYGFELSQWASNCNELLPSSVRSQDLQESHSFNLAKDECIKTLGLLWNNAADSFKYSTAKINTTQKITKRVILSATAQIFDPLGLINPITLLAKVLIQKLWCLRLNWDESIPMDLYTTWQEFAENIPLLNSLNIPRNVTTFHNVSTVEIHGFSDASERAYGACLYLRATSFSGDHSVQLLCAKSRVAPLKTISLPRLELCGALLLSQLTHKVVGALNISISSITLWTDSTIVLAWLSSEPYSFQTFVANRISEIQSLTTGYQWFHVLSKDNPADVLSRGTTPDKLIKNKLWWHGPTWLSQSAAEWPTQNFNYATEPQPELRAIKALIIRNYNSLPVLTKLSSWTRLKRVVAYCFRFSYNCKNPQARRTHSFCISELNQAEQTIVNMVQTEAFFTEIQELKQKKPIGKNSHLRSLNPFLDTNGLLRVGGRLKNANISFDHKYPAVLPKHHVTNLIINYEHIRLLHSGNEATLASLRHKFWIVNGRSAIRKILHGCIKCYRTHPKLQTELMGNLPSARVQPSRAFSCSGIDYGGPLLLKTARGRGSKTTKAYIALFVCMATKAVHIELVGDLTTDSFLGALKRFVARRGHINELQSDNATNFVGANRQLKELRSLFLSQAFQDKVVQNLTSQGISWHFIPPRSPHHGGLWEAGIKSVKNHIKRVIGDTLLMYEEMCTLLTGIEACLNSRPLTPLSNDPNDISCLTPGHFLIGDSLTAIPEPQLGHIRMNTLTRWQLVQHFQQQFWKRWSSEYLSQLQQRTKWQTRGSNPIRLDSLVLIKEDNAPPLTWSLARVTELHPGSDGVNRVVTVKTSKGSLTRSINKLCLLPNID